VWYQKFCNFFPRKKRYEISLIYTPKNQKIKFKKLTPNFIGFKNEKKSFVKNIVHKGFIFIFKLIISWLNSPWLNL
jgi:hypothetical protein